MVFDETLPGRPCFSEVLPKPSERHFGCRHLVVDNFFADFRVYQCRWRRIVGGAEMIRVVVAVATITTA